MVTVFEEMPDQKTALQETKRVLKPGGLLAITEFFPDPDYPLKSTVIRKVEKAGFILDETLGSL